MSPFPSTALRQLEQWLIPQSDTGVHILNRAVELTR